MVRFERGNVYILNFDTIVKKNIVNWRHNRPPDFTRVFEISKKIEETKQCDGIIYVANIGEILICYDGIHRYEAIKQLLRTNKTLTNLPVLVFELSEATEQKVLEHFRDLNRCIPVPDLYMKKQDSRKVQIIEEIVKYYHSRYKKFFSTSRTPRVPNENRDIFTDKLSELYDKVNPVDCEDFMKKLELMNSYYKKKFLENTTITQNLRKCLSFEFYLFLVRDWHKLNFNFGYEC